MREADMVIQFEEAPVLTTSRRASLRRLNAVFSGFVVALVLFAPLAMGANRPEFWMLWSGVIFALHGAYLALISWVAPGRKLQVMREGQWRAPMIGLTFATFVLWQILAPVSLAPDAGALGLIRILAYISLFALTLELAGQGRRMAVFLVIGIAAHALWGLAALRLFGDIALWGEKSAYFGVVTGPFVNRNSFATFLGFGLTTSLALVMARGRQRGMLALCLAVIVLALIGTGSRAGMVSSFAGAGVVFVVMRWRSGARPGRGLAEVAGLFLIVALGLALADGGARFRDLAEGVGDRGALWRHALSMAAARPFSGVGLDAFALAFEQTHPITLNPVLIWDLPHNSYLTLWVEAGFVAGSLPPLAAALALQRALIHLRRQRDPALPAAALGVGIIGALHSLVDFSLEMQANVLLFVVILVLGSGRREYAVD
ncbi:MAG: hypothetical protein CR993_01355 [Rhodobacterales bacterium]|nr:MAG: hypothetical protein CR993_01355 [Rhodobacterales bacterium]